MNASTVTLAAAVVVICLAGTLVAFGVGTAMDEPETYPEYTVAGTWEDGTALTGTAACRDTGESSIQKVLGFSYVLEHADGETVTLESFLILGSGDIGLIMARRMSLEGAEVVACVELCPYSNGLNRNIVQCLHDYNIPLYLSHTITDIKGKKRVEEVTIMKVDDDTKQPIPGTEIKFDVDTVLLSVGLIPENELSKGVGIEMDPRTSGPVVYENMETSIEGIFASGNVLHVHDLVDFVSAESAKAGKSAAEYVKNGAADATGTISVKAGTGANAIVPQKIRPANVDKLVEVFFRPVNVYGTSAIKVLSGDKVLSTFKREHMVPAEMEKIVIPKKFLEQVENNEITISIEA